jgi:hypothetical protein
MSKTKSKKSARVRQLTALIAAGLVVAAALLVFLFRDDIGELLSSKDAEAEKGTAWAFEAGSSQIFATAGNGLAIASSTGLQLLDAKGYTVVRHVCSLETPALAVSDKLVAAFDIGGTVLRVADFDGNVTEMDTEDTIISVTMNEDGCMAVTTSAVGYKGLVTVYNAALEPIYDWYSGEGYPISACVSPDSKSLAVLTAAEDGGHVHLFSLSGSDETGSYFAEGELLVDLRWMSSGRLCAISEKSAVFIKDSGEVAGTYDFGGMYLADYSFGGSGFLTLALTKYLSASASLIVTVGDGGEQLGQTEADSELNGLSASGKQVLALYSDGLTLYSQSLNRRGGADDVQSVKKALIRPDGNVIVIFTASAQIETL